MTKRETNPISKVLAEVKALDRLSSLSMFFAIALGFLAAGEAMQALLIVLLAAVGDGFPVVIPDGATTVVETIGSTVGHCVWAVLCAFTAHFSYVVSKDLSRTSYEILEKSHAALVEVGLVPARNR